ncbi:BatA domain-containing protein [Sphingomonas sp.]|uniref:BatA domain-containing protein n=1 Tax=Sphingomonas sp. TaxID=28214 RepID=UPI001EB2DFA5|nr:BatA domain-containing protein [Sphingomonas sp.]MBX3593263.1 BatA domain-containing protein [Sphingomonas sp.]
MTPLLLFPAGLAALIALAVPLLVHLRRRTEEVPIDFAALRWLDPLPRPRRRIRFDDLLLLSVRLLLIAALALLLARPAVLGAENARARVLVAPGVPAEMARRIAGPEADAQWIAPDFPSIDTRPPSGRVPLSSLIRQFDAELPRGAALTIVVPPVLDGVDAEPIRLTRQAEWRIVKADAVTQAPPATPAPALTVRHAPAQGEQVRYFRAAAAAWGAAPRFDADPGDALPPRDHVLVWLTPGPVPGRVTDWVARGGTALLGEGARVAMPGATVPLWRDGEGAPIVEGAPMGDGRLLRFTRPLVPAAIPDLFDAGFAERLRILLTPPAPAPARVDAARFAPVAGRAPYPLPPRELTAWLAMLIAVLFVIERWLATRRHRLTA